MKFELVRTTQILMTVFIIGLPNEKANSLQCEDLFITQINWHEAMSGWTKEHPESEWSDWIKRWRREGHKAEDLELVSKHVRAGALLESEGREIIERGATEPIEALREDGIISQLEYRAIEQAFQQVIVDEPLGFAESVPTLKPKRSQPRRPLVFVQEFRGIIDPEKDREIVAMDQKTLRKLASVDFAFNGYRELVVRHMFELYHEHNQRYLESLFGEILRRYPSAVAVVFELPAFEFGNLVSLAGPGASDLHIIAGSDAYHVAKQFGFHHFKLIRHTEAGFESAQIVAERSHLTK